jgi:hypothetical protein
MFDLGSGYLSCAGRKQRVADLYLVCEFATEKLVDQASNLRLIAEELTELAAFKGERPYVALGNDRRRGRPFRQESHLANEVAPFQARHLAAGDGDPDGPSR